MSEISPRLALPFLAPSQAQKHVIHNEALELLDVMVQTVITTFDADTPPAEPDPQAIYAIGSTPMGEWAGAAGHLARWADTGWIIIAPRPGWIAWGADGRGLVEWTGSSWARVQDNIDRLGIGATADDTNRLSIAAAASLFSHAGSGHQIKINKAGPSDTASVLMQTNWSGRAEIGLIGDDALAFKVSSDGNAFTEAMRIPATGAALQVNGPITGDAVQSDAADRQAGKLARADFAMMRSDIVGSVAPNATGAVIETGETPTGRYTKYADGTLICALPGLAVASTGQTWSFPAAFAAPPTISLGVQDTPAVAIHKAKTITTATIEAYDLSGTAAAATIDCVAIGRWS